jgi:DNA (cytosine-5)-methyltransferase 1
MENIKFVDFFCGIGSFHYSFKKLGWNCVMACDIDSVARQTYARNCNVEPLGDIEEINPTEIPTYDILCAGFPCQPFSQCGRHKGFDDDRGSIFFKLLKFISHHSPSIILLENVCGLLTHDKGRSFEPVSYTHLRAHET